MTTAATMLRNLPASRIIAAVADACARWANADFPPRVRAVHAVMNRLSYSEPVVDFAFDRLFGPVTVDALRATIENELGSIEALDGFVERPHRPEAFARGVDKVAIVSSDSTIGVALWPALFALCAKCSVAVKDRSDDLIGSFAQTLFEEDESFREAFRAEVWEGHESPLAAKRLNEADVAVAFGRNDALAAIRAHCRPEARFYGFGHRTSVAYLEREALSNSSASLALARAAARDALLYDGEGCLSAHAVFVERGGTVDPIDFTLSLQRACEEASVEFPCARPVDAAERTRAALSEFRAAQSNAPVLPERAFYFAYDAPKNEPPPLFARSLAVYPVQSPAEALWFVQRHALPLEAFALADPSAARPDAIQTALASGAARIGRIGRLQAPEVQSNHGGSGRIVPFVRLIVRDR